MSIPRRELLILRSAYFRHIRDFFEARGFLEVDTPLLSDGVPVESTSSPFAVTLRGQHGDRPMYLPTSPEAGLKRLLAELERDLFELGHAFRDGEQEGDRHRAHFRMLEWYRLGADYRVILTDLAALLTSLAAFFDSQGVPRPAALTTPEPRVLTVSDVFATHVGHALDSPDAVAALPSVAERMGHAGLDDWKDAFHVLMNLHVEPHLATDRPTALVDYPTGIAAQAAPHPDRPWLTQQFELYVGGVEISNCYSELTDPALQERRFEAEAAIFRARGEVPPAPDRRFLTALAALPDRVAGGCAGVERLLMVWTDTPDLDACRP